MLKSKLLLLFIIVSICTLIIIGGLFTYNLRNEKFKTIQRDFQNQLGHIDFGISNFFDEVKYNVQVLTSIEIVRTRDDKNFTNFLNANEETFQYNIGETEQKIIDIFNNYRITHPYINSVYMGRENGGFVRSHKRASPTQYDPRERPWYILGKDNPDKVVRTDPYKSVTTPDINIGIEKALVDENREVFGVVGMDITLENLTDYISNIKVGKNGWAILVDEDGTILASRDKKDQLENILTFDEENLQAMIETKQGYAIFTKDSEKNYIFYYTSPELGWKIGLIIPTGEINKEIWIFVIKITLALVSALFLLSALTLVGLQRFIIKPLGTLNNATGLITKTGNLNHYIKIKSHDEIGHLAMSFNQMMKTINESNKALKASEKALRVLNNELEGRVEKRTIELSNANVLLKELDQLKSMFIASMSHELRTPLNSIIGFTSIILHGMTGKITGEQRKQITMVKSSADHLLALITDVIDVSKIEVEKIDLTIEEFDLLNLMQEVIDSFNVIADRKGLKLSLEMPKRLVIESDVRRVKQVIMNFVSNAIKFTEEGEIGIRAVEKNGKVDISVTDSGIGIKKENMNKLFKQFSRICTKGRAIEKGTGLGLYLSKKIAYLLGGKIKARSEFGKGSVFIFTLPIKYKEVKNEKDSSGRR